MKSLERALTCQESSFNTSIAAFESAKPKQETAITRNYSAEEEQQIDRLLHQLLVRWKQTRKQVENMVQEIAGTLNKKRSEVPEFREEIGLDEVDGDMPLPSYV
jgi:transketolase